MTTPFTAYISAHALTKGVYEADAIPAASTPGAIKIGDRITSQWITKGHWHTDRASAIAAAEAMRERKIKSLRAQIEKLETMKFE